MQKVLKLHKKGGKVEMAEYRQNTNYEDFKHDDEKEGNSAYRLPFGLCNKYGIAIQDWWTPKHAWEALRNGGFVDNVSEEYKEFYRKLKKDASKEGRKRSQRRTKLKEEQKRNPEHNPDYDYQHQDGAIAGVKQGEPMTFEKADNGNCNPYYEESIKAVKSGFREGAIGYRTNCATCVATYFARRQGYDVRALPNLDNMNIYLLSTDTTLAYIKQDGTRPQRVLNPYTERKKQEFVEEQVQDGEIHAMEWTWKGKRSGHIVVVEKEAGKDIMVYDPQTNEKYSTREFFRQYGGKIKRRTLELTNLTKCNIDEQFCDRIMKGATKK